MWQSVVAAGMAQSGIQVLHGESSHEKPTEVREPTATAVSREILEQVRFLNLGSEKR